ncbi:CAP domain-containing protein [Flavobacteriaceae bacterium R38]|nr:CAP domain-containing protein [Flavobacteriaceae bacterium R38]
MNTRTYKIVVILFAVFFVNSCSKDSIEEEIPILALVDVDYTNFENEVLSRINEHRASIGLNALEISDEVSSVAQSHTEHMISTNRVSHDFFFRRRDVLRDNPGANAVSENVAFGFSTSGGVVRGWLNSEEHRAIIETPSFTHFGIAVDVDTEGRNYFTNIFIQLQ